MRDTICDKAILVSDMKYFTKKFRNFLQIIYLPANRCNSVGIGTIWFIRPFRLIVPRQEFCCKLTGFIEECTTNNNNKLKNRNL